MCVRNVLEIDHVGEFCILHYLGQNEPFLNAFDGFITSSRPRLQTTQDGKLVITDEQRSKITTYIVQIQDLFLLNEF